MDTLNHGTKSTRLPLAMTKLMNFLIGLPPAYFVLVILILFAPLVSWQLLDPNYWIVILKQSATLGIAVIAQSIVMRVRSIDLSVSGVFALALYLATSGTLSHYSPIVFILSPFVIAISTGAINGFLVAKLRASAVISTLSMSIMLIGLVQYLSAGRAPGAVPNWIRTLTNDKFLGLPWSVIIWIITSIIVSLILNYFIIGKYIRSVGDNPRAAEVTGIPLAKTVFAAHLFAGVLTGLAALIQIASLSNGTIKPGLDTFMNALAATILGGVSFGVDKGGVAGPFVAVIAFSFLFAVLTNFGLQEPGKLIVQGTIIALAAIVYGARRT